MGKGALIGAISAGRFNAPTCEIVGIGTFVTYSCLDDSTEQLSSVLKRIEKALSFILWIDRFMIINSLQSSKNIALHGACNPIVIVAQLYNSGLTSFEEQDFTLGNTGLFRNVLTEYRRGLLYILYSHRFTRPSKTNIIRRWARKHTMYQSENWNRIDDIDITTTQ